jgi:hypothetical protein
LISIQYLPCRMHRRLYAVRRIIICGCFRIERPIDLVVITSVVHITDTVDVVKVVNAIVIVIVIVAVAVAVAVADVALYSSDQGSRIVSLF